MSYGHTTYKSQSVQQLEWKQTDRRTDTTDRINFSANVVGDDILLCYVVHFDAYRGSSNCTNTVSQSDCCDGN